MASPEPRPPRRFPSLVRRRAASFGYAARGVWAALRTEVHLWFHAVATAAVVGLGLYFGLARWEWVAVALAVGAVWCAELLNTAIEAVVNLASPDYHPLAGRAKDVAAGAVLVMALAALVVGLLVFGPRVWQLAQAAGLV
ncbi:diacylglycerol kinase family protein [Hymenobacter weizhouensis]|uniref:diacylglycerol kinase family protein n=1 Tax=Hymenobacter sp. YIM 151500-1 TaxID=2987689 RepID=UPI002225E72D|nr:diacylglycerol kinase family protein [Hymenobacter sp. YIM 151500-1]UYZ62375.1 diacylglycerol kinase family protein [Hymenobacter sp. YIM 151500-1]